MILYNYSKSTYTNKIAMTTTVQKYMQLRIHHICPSSVGVSRDHGEPDMCPVLIENADGDIIHDRDGASVSAQSSLFLSR